MADPAQLQRCFELILDKSRDCGAGGATVLETAYHVLSAGNEIARWPDVGLEDLWTHALQEGAAMFRRPETLWGPTGPEQTRDMIGQTTLGPWQITIDNVRTRFGLPYGIGADWPPDRVADFCRQRPVVHAGMICDYIQSAYSELGRRSPYAIQSYFWLAAFVKGEIGQGAWDRSVLAVAPDGDYRKLTPELKRDTGFYAKQIVCGHKHNPRGLLYWLWVTRDRHGIAELLRTWRDQLRRTWDESAGKAVLTGEPGRFALTADDLRHVPDPACRDDIAAIIAQFAGE